MSEKEAEEEEKEAEIEEEEAEKEAEKEENQEREAKKGNLKRKKWFKEKEEIKLFNHVVYNSTEVLVFN